MADPVPRPIGDETQLREACDAVLAAARRRLYVLSQHLDTGLLDRPPVLDILLRLIRRSRYTRLCILVKDSAPAVRDGNRLIALHQRVPSRLPIHRLAEDFADERRAFIVADDHGWLLRPDGLAPAGEFALGDRPGAAALAAAFEDLWARSGPDLALRRLDL
ncbi:MAG: hypothetical protein KatS3mg121_0193 [Gammaproteobacteria bacterium]|nr:MAG: hypothetical protein KatS3mg121_0193 [Gammaproteobacteria bacterium]